MERNALLKVKYDSAGTHFLQPYGLIVQCANPAELTEYVLHKYGELRDPESGTAYAAWYVRDQINKDTGVDFKTFQVSKHFFDEDCFLVKFYCPKAYTMFKLKYSGQGTFDNESQ